MTEPIVLEFDGDCWSDPEKFRQQIHHFPANEPLVLDLSSEGPSIEALGVTDVINDWLKNRQQSPDTVHLSRYSNPVEYVPYKRINNSKVSHFFYMVKDYWQHNTPTLEKQLQYYKPFGIFIGRLTISRAAIFYKLMRPGTGSVGSQFFASLMQNPQPFLWKLPNDHKYNLENISDWLSLYDQVNMFNWFDSMPVTSIDNKLVSDQFVTPTSYVETNASLLKHYHNFAVEIVCETYTIGNTFFPTEKTIRPLMAAKPMIVYGPRYYLARLRGLGFRTYHEIWDESYDFHQGPDRWNLMRKTMNRLLECGRSTQHEILSQAHEIAIYNRQRLSQICNRQIDVTDHDYLV